MRVVVTGGTGFIGRSLVAHLAGLGYECTVLTRNAARAANCGLPRGVRIVKDGPFPAADAVIHLAGESVAALWTPRKRREILASRVEGTRRLVKALRDAKVRPHTLLAASAVGFYGDRPGELLDESSAIDPRGSFRSRVCGEWEAAAAEADLLGMRVVHLRLGNVLDPRGGYLGGLLPIYRWLGGFTLGAPEAKIPWISRTDAVRLIAFALAHERWFGALNLAAPRPVTHREFARGLSQRLGRPFFGAMPPSLVRLALGEFSTALLDDQEVVPAKALQAGFTFEHPTWNEWAAEAFSRGAAAPLPAGEVAIVR